MARLLLAGYFGCGNYGDDAILLGFIEGIRSTGHQFSILANQPERMIRTYGLTAVPRMDAASVKSAISECDALVFPGGSIFQDVTSVRSVFYYWNLVKTAKKQKKKVMLLAQGVGPVNKWMGKRLTRASFDRADLVTVRDPQSAQTLKSLGCKINPRVTVDMAFLLPEPDLQEGTSFGAGGMKTVGLSARPYGRDRNKQVIELYSELARLLFQGGYMPVMMAMDEVDQPLIDEISKKNGGKIPDLKGLSGPGPLQQRIARMEAVIAMRLHAGILATTVGVPPYMLSYDPKVNAFANSMGFGTPPSMEGLTAGRVFDGFQAFIKDRERMSENLKKKREDFAKQARVNIELLVNALG